MLSSWDNTVPRLLNEAWATKRNSFIKTGYPRTGAVANAVFSVSNSAGCSYLQLNEFLSCPSESNVVTSFLLPLFFH